VIRASFNERRKTLLNGLSHFQEFDFSKEELAGAIERCGLPGAVRGEKLGLTEFAALANELVKVASESN
jgi:16S rRNA (adenine1518-N6/adenine1519-N6)-dimethyltransferase